jgi:hypothetical protein
MKSKGILDILLNIIPITILRKLLDHLDIVLIPKHRLNLRYLIEELQLPLVLSLVEWDISY